MVPYQIMMLAALIFSIGVVGVLIRRNSIVVFMCIELMLNSVNLSFVAAAKMLGNIDGQLAVFFVMVVAAAEAAIGLAIVLSLFRHNMSVESTDATDLRR